jgi:hypothetical protein
MSRFRNTTTGVVVSVDDSKDGRFKVGYEPVDEAPVKKAPAKKAAASRTEK